MVRPVMWAVAHPAGRGRSPPEPDGSAAVVGVDGPGGSVGAAVVAVEWCTVVGGDDGGRSVPWSGPPVDAVVEADAPAEAVVGGVEPPSAPAIRAWIVGVPP